MLAPSLGALLERRERPFKAAWPLLGPASGAGAAEAAAAKAAFAASTACLASCKSTSASS